MRDSKHQEEADELNQTKAKYRTMLFSNQIAY